MIGGLLVLAGALAADPPASPSAPIAEAIAAGRLVQAEKMIEGARAAAAPDANLPSLEAALALAKRQCPEASGKYLSLIAAGREDAVTLSGAGIAALCLHQNAEALSWLKKAAAIPDANWRTWNALGIALDRKGDWAGSAAAYERAKMLAPNQAQIWNNEGYSLLLQKRVEEALPALEHAAALDPNDKRIAVNRQVARAMAGVYPSRGEGESSRAWAARLNNAGYAAWLNGDAEKARSLFARAIEASETHYDRATQNLATAEASLRK